MGSLSGRAGPINPSHLNPCLNPLMAVRFPLPCRAVARFDLLHVLDDFMKRQVVDSVIQFHFAEVKQHALAQRLDENW